MFNIKKYKSKDDYYLYKLISEDKSYYLADKDNYKKNIQNLIDNLEGILFDSVVIIFGIDSGEYIKALKSKLCERNRVIMIEPNKDIYDIAKEKIVDDNIHLIHYDEQVIKAILRNLINHKNFNRLHVHCFGNYKDVYIEEYEKFIGILDNIYYTSSSSIAVVSSFKKIFFGNMISNLSIINDTSSLNSYIDKFKNTPAIIVSAGPSLDRNIQTMLKYKNCLDKFFIIAGNRTMGSLIENGIKPNLVVSVDPAQVTYDMMKKYLDSDVPLAFYEYSNKDLVKEYRGEKIYISELFSRTIEDLKDLSRTYIGGSVAHTCIDIAKIIGCNKIILVGQDCALTENKHHSYNSTFDIDKTPNELEVVLDKDIYGDEIRTTLTLKFFKTKIEEYINLVKEEDESKYIEFINASYGADIEGAPHKELEEIITSSEFNKNIENLIPNKSINIDYKEIINSILEHINNFIVKSDECINICNEFLNNDVNGSLMDMDEDDINLQNFLYLLHVVDEFEYSTKSYYLGGYFTEFLFDVRKNYFEMPAQDYSKLTSDFKYQSETFLHYFQDLNSLLKVIKELLLTNAPNVD